MNYDWNRVSYNVVFYNNDYWGFHIDLFENFSTERRKKLTNRKRRKIMNLLARFYHADKLDIALNEKFF